MNDIRFKSLALNLSGSLASSFNKFQKINYNEGAPMDSMLGGGYWTADGPTEWCTNGQDDKDVPLTGKEDTIVTVALNSTL